MKQSLLKKILTHRFYLSVALSDTSRVHGLHISTYRFCMNIALVAAGLTYGSYELFKGEPVVVQADSGHLIPYEEEIDRLEKEKGLHEKQLRIFAYELGVLQARLDRFDAIGEKLFNDPDLGKHLEGVEELGGKGSAKTPEMTEAPSLGQMRGAIEQIQQRTEHVDGLMQAGLKLMSRTQLTQSQKPHLWPVVHKRTYKSSNYGWRKDPFNGGKDWHDGMDIAAGYNAPIVASADGVVIFAGYRYGFGNMVEIRHAGNLVSRYAHLNKVTTKNGVQIKGGELIGLMGSSGRSTGPHLHFEVLMGDNRVDPAPFVKDGREYARQLARQGYGKKLVELAKK